MDYFRNIVVVAAIAGIVAGIGMTIAQQLVTVPMILKAEVFEEQSALDGSSPANAAGEAVHDHGAQAGARAHDHHAHDHGEGWSPADGIERTAFTLLANVVTNLLHQVHDWQLAIHNETAPTTGLDDDDAQKHIIRG